MTLNGCASSELYQYDLISIPVTFNETVSKTAVERAPFEGLLFATDREPRLAKDSSVSGYRNQRASAVRVGIVKIEYSGEPDSQREPT